MRLLFPVLLIGLLSLNVCAEAAQAPEASFEPQDATVQALISKLNAEDPLRREDAERELLRLGPSALPSLKEAVNSQQPEIAARARRLVSRLTERAMRPSRSYAEVFPASSLFFLEFGDTRRLPEEVKQTPFGKFWQSPEMRQYLKGHHAAQAPDDQKLWESIGNIGKLADGRALLALGAPETIEANELDPPLVYLLESAQGQSLETQVRAFFALSGDAPRTTRRYGPFTIDEHLTAQTVFGQDGVIHSLTQMGMESFLQQMLKRPVPDLFPAVTEARALLEKPACVFYVSSSGFEQLADAAQLIDDDQIRYLSALGFVTGSTLRGALAFNSDGVQERMLLKPGGGEKNAGLLNVLKKMAAAMPPPPAAGKPQALDLIPWQAGLLVSFQGDVSRNATALAEALRQWDRALQPEPVAKSKSTSPKKNAKPDKGEANFEPPPEKKAEGAGPGGLPAATPAQKIMRGTEGALNAEAADGHAPEDVPAQPPGNCPHVARVEKIGLKLEQLLEQVDGPVQLALFFRQIGKEAPDTLPISPLIGVVLKNSDAVRQALDAAVAAPNPLFRTELLNGGVHYIETDGDPDRRPGFWLKGNYLAYSTERDLLDLASLTCLHEKGTERIADRPTYKQALASQRLDSSALLTVFGDADQVLEMPYKLARIQWEDNPETPWPDYEVLKAFLQYKPVVAQLRTAEDGLKVVAQTPLGLLGMFLAFRQPLLDAGL